MRMYGTAVALLFLLSISLYGQGQGQGRPPVARPWPPANTADGQPNVEGAWRPVSGGTHSLDPALTTSIRPGPVH